MLLVVELMVSMMLGKVALTVCFHGASFHSGRQGWLPGVLICWLPEHGNGRALEVVVGMLPSYTAATNPGLMVQGKLWDS